MTTGTTAEMNKEAVGNYASVNGLNMYYEIHGTGHPLVLLHGSYMNIDLNWSRLIPDLAKSRKVIALEMQSHGRTADTDRPLSYAALADDVAGLLKHLHIGAADILGYSLGATVALETAIRHPQLVAKLVFVSSVFRHDGWLKEVRNIFDMLAPEFFEQTPLKSEYDRLAPDPGYWKAFVTKVATFDRQPFDLGADKIRTLTCPVFIIKGDNDGVDLAHTTELYRLLGGDRSGDVSGLPNSQLAVLPGTTHISLMERTDWLVPMVTEFLDAPTPEGK